MKSKLGERDHLTMAEWARFELKHGHAPTLADILAFGIDKSTSTVKYRIDGLIDLGYLERCGHCPPDAARTVRMASPRSTRAAASG